MFLWVFFPKNKNMWCVDAKQSKGEKRKNNKKKKKKKKTPTRPPEYGVPVPVRGHARGAFRHARAPLLLPLRPGAGQTAPVTSARHCWLIMLQPKTPKQASKPRAPFAPFRAVWSLAFPGLCWPPFRE